MYGSFATHVSFVAVRTTRLPGTCSALPDYQATLLVFLFRGSLGRFGYGFSSAVLRSLVLGFFAALLAFTIPRLAGFLPGSRVLK